LPQTHKVILRQLFGEELQRKLALANKALLNGKNENLKMLEGKIKILEKSI